MSDDENQVPPTTNLPPKERQVPEDTTSFDPSLDQELDTPQVHPAPPPNDQLGGCAASSLGCFSGFLYLFIIFLLTIGGNVIIFAHMEQAVFNVLALIGPLAVWYFAKQSHNISIFWGFLVPYLLILLLFGMCSR